MDVIDLPISFSPGLLKTPGLHRLLLEAHLSETCHARPVHGTELILPEDVLFTSLFEGATVDKKSATRVRKTRPK